MAASLIRYKSLDLPVYPPGTEIVYPKFRLKEISAQDGARSFVRGTLISTLLNGEGRKINSLQELLHVADEGFAKVAAGCGAMILRYSWGLYNFRQDPSPDAAAGAQALGRHQSYLQPDNDLLPTGHILVAEVEAIKPLPGETELLPPSLTQHNLIESSSGAYSWPRMRDEEPYWADARSEQFANGVSLEQGRGLFLLDIEPKIVV